jgi:spermidine synthase
MRSRRVLLYGLTFVVAFCSIAYELAYSELLRTLFGGTVVRYSITIGLFLFSFGVGSFLYRRLDDDPSGFFRVEVLLAIAGPAGFLLVLVFNSVPELGGALPRDVRLVVSHSPIVFVGLLSGLEVPYLTELVDEGPTDAGGSGGDGDPDATGGDGEDARGDEASDGGDSEAVTSSFASVLGMDYVGSLAGTVVYAIVLYPAVGLFSTVFVLGLLNGLAALGFALRFHADIGIGRTAPTTDGGRPAGEAEGGEDGPDDASGDAPRPEPGAGRAGGTRGESGVGAALTAVLRRLAGRVGAGPRVLFVVCLLVTATYATAVANGDVVDDELTSVYATGQIEAEWEPGRTAEVQVREQFTTRYQDVLVYDRRIEGKPGTQRCLRLDMALQLCDSWVESYHAGLVDVPMSTLEDPANASVLLIGGGDHIAVDRLREYDVRVDRVDIDAEFMEWARNDSFLRQYHDDAYRYDRLETHVGDAYAYLRGTDERYDLVLIDLPGARNDDAMPLYSVEFYSLLRTHLTDDGVVATWSYSRYAFPAHYRAYMSTVHAAGFDSYLQYAAYEDLDGDGRSERAEGFYLLSPDPPGSGPTLAPSRARNPSIERNADRYRAATWRPTPRYRGVAPNSVFDPNYDITVTY